MSTAGPAAFAYSSSRLLVFGRSRALHRRAGACVAGLVGRRLVVDVVAVVGWGSWMGAWEPVSAGLIAEGGTGFVGRLASVAVYRIRPVEVC